MDTLRVILLSILNVIFGIVGLVLGLRIVLKVFAANASIPVVSWIYNVTDKMIQPFSGISPNITLGSQSVFDIVAFIALLAYSIVFYIIASLIRGFVHSVRSEEHIVHDHM